MDMKTFDANGVKIAYLDEGAGEPILLVHGFASTAHVNWVNTGWVETLVGAGFRVIAVDNRGHGQSEKLYDEAAYMAPMMADDALALMSHLGFSSFDVMGYSMGARVSAFMALKEPSRIRRLIIAGMGEKLIHGVGGAEEISQALLADSLDDVKGVQGRGFRAFAEQTGADLKALASCIKATRVPIDERQVASIAAPTLIAVGTRDEVAGSPHKLAGVMQNAQVLEITGRDHMRAVGDKIYKEGVLAFLAGTTTI